MTTQHTILAPLLSARLVVLVAVVAVAGVSYAADASRAASGTAWFEAKHYPYLDLQAGLSRHAMKELGWFNDNIHLAPPGGRGIGEAIARLFLP